MSNSVIKSKRIMVGVTGGIAAYKSAELVRLLVKAGADVHVCMTDAATRFITPLTLETLSGNKVRTQVFANTADSSIEHTEFGRDMDAAVVAPATADFLGRLAGGLADQLLLCALMASEMPVLLCPAMNVVMWNNPLVQRNLDILNTIKRYHWLDPDEGELACKVQGKGRLPDPSKIVQHLTKMLTPQDLLNKRIVVTAGPTREWIDPVRFLSNPSTGRMGYALAEAAWQRGAQVDLVSGPSDLGAPEGVAINNVGTTEELLSVVSGVMKGSDALIMAAAPADFAPNSTVDRKIKKTEGHTALELRRTPDILGTIAPKANGTLLVGFAAETHQLAESAKSKVSQKGLDLIFANAVGHNATNTGFASGTNGGLLMDNSGTVIEEIAVQSKHDVAHRILDHVVARLK